MCVIVGTWIWSWPIFCMNWLRTYSTICMSIEEVCGPIDVKAPKPRGNEVPNVPLKIIKYILVEGGGATIAMSVVVTMCMVGISIDIKSCVPIIFYWEYVVFVKIEV